MAQMYHTKVAALLRFPAGVESVFVRDDIRILNAYDGSGDGCGAVRVLYGNAFAKRVRRAQLGDLKQRFRIGIAARPKRKTACGYRFEVRSIHDAMKPSNIRGMQAVSLQPRVNGLEFRRAKMKSVQPSERWSGASRSKGPRRYA
jgi:hypothetical protein